MSLRDAVPESKASRLVYRNLSAMALVEQFSVS